MADSKIIKEIQKQESNISTILGIIVVIVIGVFLFKYFKGQSIKLIPEKETQATPTAILEEEKQGVYPKGQLATLPAKYIVQKGDSLWKISEKFYKNGAKWMIISRENNVKNPGIILPGQELNIPVLEGQTVAQPITGSSYTVVKGDNLWNISVRAYQDGFKWPIIAKANNLANPNLIHPGNILTLPR